MRTINTKIENGRVFQKIEYEMDWSDVDNITSYMIEMESSIVFKDGDTEEHYDNLLDSTENFKFEDCETLFSLGIVNTSSYNGNTEFELSECYEEELKKLKRLHSINTVIDD